MSAILLEQLDLDVKRVFLLLGFILLLVGGVWWWKGVKIDLMTPLSTGKEKRIKSEYKIVGFLPTWMIGKTIIYGDQLTDLIFLGVGVSQSGDLIWETQSKKLNSEEYLKIKREIERNGGNNILGIKLFEDEMLGVLIKDIKARENLITQLKAEVNKGGFRGVNIDFEYQGDPTKVLEPEFINFLKQLKAAGLGNISLDVFANTVIKGSTDQLLVLMQTVDELIVMAYDFHRPGVDYVGPVAPIRSLIGERSIWEVVERINLLTLNGKKIVLAYPLYGYEWKTETVEFESKIKRGWYQMASLRRMEDEVLPALATMSGKESWDELSMTPWLSFVEDGSIRQIYYENERSLQIKMDLIKQNKLAGVGFWALGYEAKPETFWGKIDKMLAN